MLKYLAFFFILFFSCAKEEAENDTMSGATWKISYFFNGTEETGNYAAFYFMFNDDGTLMAHEGSKLTIGRWSQSGNRFNILFDANPTLLKLKGDWLILEKTAALIKLKDDIATIDKQLHLIRQ